MIIAEMKKANLEGMTKEEAGQLALAMKWVSSKFSEMTQTLYELHQRNQAFLSEFYRKQQVIDRHIYELRGTGSPTYPA